MNFKTFCLCFHDGLLPCLLLFSLILGLSGCHQELTAERDALKVQLERLHKQLATAQAERAQWQAQHAEADQTLLTIRQELQAQLDQHTQALQQAERQYQDKNQQLQALQAAQGALRAEIGHRESELAHVESNLRHAFEERDAYKRQLAQLQSDLKVVQTQRDDWQNRYHEVNQAFKTLQVELTTAHQGGDEARHTLAAQLVQSDNELSHLRAQYEMVAAQLQSANTAHQTRTTVVLDRLEQVLERFQLSGGGNEDGREETHEQNGHEASSTQLLMAMREEMAGSLQTVLQQELNSLKTAVSQQTTQQFETARTAWQTQLVQSQRELAQQQERLRRLHAEQEAMEAQRTQLQAALETAQTHQSQCEAQHAKTMQTLLTTRDQVTALKNELAANQLTLDQYQSATQSHQHRIHHLYEVTATQLQTTINDQSVALQPQADRILLRVGGHILFQPGHVTLRAEGQQTLDDVAAILKTLPNSSIHIEGHTDDRPIKDGRSRCWPTNWELSAVRAASAARYLEAQGVTPERMTVSGASFHRPLAPNDTREGRAQNCRLEMSLHPSGN